MNILNSTADENNEMLGFLWGYVQDIPVSINKKELLFPPKPKIYIVMVVAVIVIIISSTSIFRLFYKSLIIFM